MPRTRWASLLGCCPSWGAAPLGVLRFLGGSSARRPARLRGRGQRTQYSPSKSDWRLWAAERPSKSPELQFMLQKRHPAGQ